MRPKIVFLVALLMSLNVLALSYDEIIEEAVSQGVPRGPLVEAIDYYMAHQHIIENKDTITLVDFSQHSMRERMYLVDMNEGYVDRYLVAHGKGSDPDHDGYADRFSDIHGSKMSSLGFYLTAEPYIGRWGRAMRLDGLEESNKNARDRAIVMHGADYVSPNRTVLGRSWGCPAVELDYIEGIVARIKDRSLFYIFN